MSAAKPTNPQGFVILVVMGVDGVVTTDFTAELFEIAGDNGTLHGKMSIVLHRVGTAPICLPSLTFDHSRVPIDVVACVGLMPQRLP